MQYLYTVYLSTFILKQITHGFGKNIFMRIMGVSVFSLRILTWQKSFHCTEILQNSLLKNPAFSPGNRQSVQNSPENLSDWNDFLDMDNMYFTWTNFYQTKWKIHVYLKVDQILNSPQPPIQGVGLMLK